jgi:hypothetical protein
VLAGRSPIERPQTTFVNRDEEQHSHANPGITPVRSDVVQESRPVLTVLFHPLLTS